MTPGRSRALQLAVAGMVVLIVGFIVGLVGLNLEIRSATAIGLSGAAIFWLGVIVQAGGAFFVPAAYLSQGSVAKWVSIERGRIPNDLMFEVGQNDREEWQARRFERWMVNFSTGVILGSAILIAIVGPLPELAPLVAIMLAAGAFCTLIRRWEFPWGTVERVLLGRECLTFIFERGEIRKLSWSSRAIRLTLIDCRVAGEKRFRGVPCTLAFRGSRRPMGISLELYNALIALGKTNGTVSRDREFFGRRVHELELGGASPVPH